MSISRRATSAELHLCTGQMAVCCQNLPLGALSSHCASSMLVGKLFKKFGLFLKTQRFMEMW